MAARSPAFRWMDVVDASTSSLSCVSAFRAPSTSAAAAAPTSEDVSASRRELSAAPAATASAASWPVTPTTRRTPLATALSSTRAKPPRLSVLGTCEPPQSSIENPSHRASSGAARSSGTVGPMDTTRTGSGYRSPKTARKLLMARALSRGTVWMSTGSCAPTDSRTSSSTRAHSDGVIACEWEKSKRALLSSTREPFCETPSPSTWCSARFIMCVSVCDLEISSLRPHSTEQSTRAPTASRPTSSVPTCST
mmetsp:Transcript_14775/g.33778  ORF Transcript_14775/g.33778 Transcript_14775/m.33778 type:complete len:252 (-) Transcript_14775:68-823(-)